MEAKSLLQPLGSANVPIRWADARALARELDGAGAPMLSFASVRPLADRVPDSLGRIVDRGQSTFTGFDRLSAAFAYRTVAALSRGMLTGPQALGLAEAERAKGPGRVSRSHLQAVKQLASEFVATLRSQAAEADQRAAAIARMSTDNRALELRGQASAARDGAGGIERSFNSGLDAELLALGFGGGAERGVLVAGIMHLFRGVARVDGGIVNKLNALVPESEQLRMPQYGLNDAQGVRGYGSDLLLRIGVPLTSSAYNALDEEAKAMWRRDPSFDPSLFLPTGNPAGLPDAIVEMEQRVDADLDGSSLTVDRFARIRSLN